MEYLFLFIICIHVVTSNVIPLNLSENRTNEEVTSNQTLAALVQQQTETIKKIVADQQESQLEYSNEDSKTETKKELTIEELKAKCQHLSKLLNNTMETKPVVSNKNERIDNHYSSYVTKYNNKPYNFQRRPVYVQPNYTIKSSVTQKTNGFYITTQPTILKKSSVVVPSTPLPHNVKFIRLEPVILQKTILSDGRTIYYWHRSLPTAVQYPSKVDGQTITFKQITTTTEPSTTASSYMSYDFRNLFPSFYSSQQESQSSTSTTTTSTTTEKPTSTTTIKTTTTSTKAPSDELLYSNQLRFVVPVPYDNTAPKYPWDFDEYAYYPKELQPSTVNVQVPYQSQFHMIKSLTIPNKVVKDNNDDIENINI